MILANQMAFDATKELVQARLSGSTMQIDGSGGEKVAAYFEAIYTKLAEIAKNCTDVSN